MDQECSFYRKSFEYFVVTKIENQNFLVHRVSNSKMWKMYMVHDTLGSDRYHTLQFDKIFRVNFFHSFYCFTTLFPYLNRRKYYLMALD